MSDIKSTIKSAALSCDGIASVTDACNISELTFLSERILHFLKCAIYPQCFSCDKCLFDTESKITKAAEFLMKAATLCGVDDKCAQSAVLAVANALPGIKRLLETDLRAAYAGDPAAKNYSEIILAYPAFEAISAYRIAHILYKEGIPTLPRLITEYAHRRTGIDIHPGACIGESFFIDHGTGVVIGETTVIGDNVKLYQGVTLGAKSFVSDEDGNLIKGMKRHPNIGNNVTIYARATLLGDITIGDNYVIGGNIWLIESVEADKTIVLSRDKAYDILDN